MNICFLEKTDFCYNSKNLYSESLRGAETVLLNLSNALSKQGHKITIINNCPQNEIINNINWFNIEKYTENQTFDIAFSNNDTRLFNKVRANKKILISHSLQTIEKFIRKSQLISYFKHKPKVLVLSDYHKKKQSKLLSIYGTIQCGWAVDDIFINSKLNENLNNKQAIFTSKFDRNGKLLVDIWNKYIQPKNKDLKLLITPKITNNHNPNIIERSVGNQNNMLKDLSNSRMLLIPGHKAELYCLAAEEGRELCVPIITMGIGSLKERVFHGKTGLIAKNEKEFSEFVLQLFSDDYLWNKLRLNLIELRNSNNWMKVSEKLLKLI